MNAVMKPVPKLRFSEFTDEWVLKKLGNISTTFSGGTPTSTNRSFYEGKIPFIKSGEISFSKTKECISGEALQASSAKSVEKGDILYALYGATSGQVAISKIDGAINQAVLCIRPAANTYFIYSKLTADKSNILKTYLQGGQGNLSAEIVKNIKVSLPSRSEQEKIADFLMAVDKKIELLEKRLELLKQYKKGVMQKIFTQQIRFKDVDGGNYPNWEEKKLGSVVKVVGGGTPDTSNPGYWGGRIAWLTPSEVKGRYITSSQRTITEQGLQNSSAKILPPGAIIFTSRATVGEVAIAKMPITTNQGFQSMIANKAINNVFVYYWARYSRKEFLIKSSGSTFMEISSNELRKVRINLPCLEEQQKITDFLESLDEKIDSISENLRLAKLLRRALLQRIFP